MASAQGFDEVHVDWVWLCVLGCPFWIPSVPRWPCPMSLRRRIWQQWVPSRPSTVGQPTTRGSCRRRAHQRAVYNELTRVSSTVRWIGVMSRPRRTRASIWQEGIFVKQSPSRPRLSTATDENCTSGGHRLAKIIITRALQSHIPSLYRAGLRVKAATLFVTGRWGMASGGSSARKYRWGLYVTLYWGYHKCYL